jgi:hypothetical protein
VRSEIRASDWLPEEIKAVVREAVAQLQKETNLFGTRANERSITHRLAVHLERIIPGWNIDCEYNRIGRNWRRYKLLFMLSDDDYSIDGLAVEGSRVFPDIVVHHRGDNSLEDNLLVIEVKTTWSKASLDRDREKLRAFTGQIRREQELSYRFGVFLVFDEAGNVMEDDFLFLVRSF